MEMIDLAAHVSRARGATTSVLNKVADVREDGGDESPRVRRRKKKKAARRKSIAKRRAIQGAPEEKEGFPAGEEDEEGGGAKEKKGRKKKTKESADEGGEGATAAAAAAEPPAPVKKGRRASVAKKGRARRASAVVPGPRKSSASSRPRRSSAAIGASRQARRSSAGAGEGEGDGMAVVPRRASDGHAKPPSSHVAELFPIGRGHRHSAPDPHLLHAAGMLPHQQAQLPGHVEVVTEQVDGSRAAVRPSRVSPGDSEDEPTMDLSALVQRARGAAQAGRRASAGAEPPVPAPGAGAITMGGMRRGMSGSTLGTMAGADIRVLESARDLDNFLGGGNRANGSRPQ